MLVYWASILQSLLRRPENVGYYVVSYPKSGSNWMCNMLSSYFSIPVLESWNEQLPVMAKRIYHLHRILPFRRIDNRTVYIVRDGRDVVVSYFFEMVRSPHASVTRNKFFKYIGRTVTEADIREVLGEFIDFLYTYRRASIRYDTHLKSARKRNFINVRYEDLIKNTPDELTRVVARLTDQAVDVEGIRQAVDNNSIDRVRTAANAYFVRKGEPGNWRKHFNRKAAQRFWAKYSAVMKETGYEESSAWIDTLSE
jgi:hypothetical protein